MQKNKRPHRQKRDVLYFGLSGIPQYFVPQIRVQYNKSKLYLGKVTTAKEVADFIRKTYGKGQIELQEAYVILYLNAANEIIGYYKHTIGGITQSILDPRIVFSVAVTSLSTSIIISHNHPSGKVTPSPEDEQLTKQIQQAGMLLKIRLLDHVIVTKNDYYSFNDHNKL